MAETQGKKEKEKLKARKKQEKADKRAERKLDNNKGKGLDAMLMYVDEMGNLTHLTPEEQEKKKNARKNNLENSGEEGIVTTGVLNQMLEDKGFGFIMEDGTRDKVFVHISAIREAVVVGDKVSFTKEKTAKGLKATNIRKINF